MYKIEIYAVGKHKDSWLIQALSTFESRLKGESIISWHIFKKEETLWEKLISLPSFVLLDEKGEMMTSVKFSHFLLQQTKNCFVIGGANGVSEKFHAKATKTISFSRMTFTHQHIRLLLVEQIYRAFTLQKGTPYHK